PGALRLRASAGRLEELVEDPEPASRAMAIETLARLGHEPSLPAIVRALDDVTDEVHAASVAALSRMDAGAMTRTLRVQRRAAARRGGRARVDARQPPAGAAIDHRGAHGGRRPRDPAMGGGGAGRATRVGHRASARAAAARSRRGRSAGGFARPLQDAPPAR